MDHTSEPPAEIEFPTVQWPDESAAADARARHDTLLKPRRSLGKLEELGAWLAACQGQSPPRALARPRAVVVAADHGVATREVSAYPPQATAEFTRAALTGGTALNALAETAGTGLRVADLAVDVDDPLSGAEGFRVRRSSGAIDVEDALSAEEAAGAVRSGMSLADAEVDAGADLLIPATIGVGASTPAAVLIAALTGSEPVAVTGRGSGIDDRAWMRKVRAVRDALRRTRGVRDDPMGLLRTAGGADIGCVAGFLAQAAVRRTPVLLDGLTSATAALLAERLAPGARTWWTPAQRYADPAHGRALDDLDLRGLLTLDISLEQGAAATAALPLLRMSADVLTEMDMYSQAPR